MTSRYQIPQKLCTLLQKLCTAYFEFIKHIGDNYIGLKGVAGHSMSKSGGASHSDPVRDDGRASRARRNW